jgi:hypothetical protein
VRAAVFSLLSPRGTSGERVGERGFLCSPSYGFLIKHSFSPLNAGWDGAARPSLPKGRVLHGTNLVNR